MKQPQAVAPLGRADMNRAHAHAEARILGVAQPTLDAPALAVEAHQFFGSRVGAAGGQTPGLFHLLVLRAQHGPHLIAVGRHQGAAQDAGAPAGSNKGSGGLLQASPAVGYAVVESSSPTTALPLNAISHDGIGEFHNGPTKA